MTDAILFVGHGTRNGTGQRQFLRLAEHIRAVLTIPLGVAYIEIQSPSVAEALVEMYRQGLKKIKLAPALLFAAGHAKQDIPAAVAEAKSHCADLQVSIAEPLGCHPKILDLAAQRVQNSLSSTPRNVWSEGPALPDHLSAEFALVVIGRGSSDPSAIEHCQEFASRLAALLKIETVHTGFIAIAQPTLPAALEQAAAAGARTVAVFPHLLFSGEMLDTTAAAVARAREKSPHIDWRLSDCLGADLEDPLGIASLYLLLAIGTRIKEVKLD